MTTIGRRRSVIYVIISFIKQYVECAECLTKRKFESLVSVLHLGLRGFNMYRLANAVVQRGSFDMDA
jgi:hypothetical protein